jgi:hypothetical protein
MPPSKGPPTESDVHVEEVLPKPKLVQLHDMMLRYFQIVPEEEGFLAN